MCTCLSINDYEHLACTVVLVFFVLVFLWVCPIWPRYELTSTDSQTRSNSTLTDLIWLKVLRNSCTVPYLLYWMQEVLLLLDLGLVLSGGNKESASGCNILNSPTTRPEYHPLSRWLPTLQIYWIVKLAIYYCVATPAERNYGSDLNIDAK